MQVLTPFFLYCLGIDTKRVLLCNEVLTDDTVSPRDKYETLSGNGTTSPPLSFISTGCLAALLLLGIDSVDVNDALIPAGTWGERERDYIMLMYSLVVPAENVSSCSDFNELLMIFLEGLLTQQSLLPVQLFKDTIFNILMGVVSSFSSDPSSVTPPHLISSVLLMTATHLDIIDKDNEIVS